MIVELIGALAIFAGVVMVVLVTRCTAPRQRQHTTAPTEISSTDRRLLPFFKLTQAQWVSLTDSQRADLRSVAHRAMN